MHTRRSTRQNPTPRDLSLSVDQSWAPRKIARDLSPRVGGASRVGGGGRARRLLVRVEPREGEDYDRDVVAIVALLHLPHVRRLVDNTLAHVLHIATLDVENDIASIDIDIDTYTYT